MYTRVNSQRLSSSEMSRTNNCSDLRFHVTWLGIHPVYTVNSPRNIVFSRKPYKVLFLRNSFWIISSRVSIRDPSIKCVVILGRLPVDKTHYRMSWSGQNRIVWTMWLGMCSQEWSWFMISSLDSLPIYEIKNFSLYCSKRILNED